MTGKVPESFRDYATPQLFLRNATGLVKGWSRFDAFVYSYVSVNFVTLGLYFSLSVLPFVATGQVIPALILSAIFVSFLVFSYAGLISSVRPELADMWARNGEPLPYGKPPGIGNLRPIIRSLIAVGNRILRWRQWPGIGQRQD